MKSVLFVLNTSRFFFSHRLSLAEALIKQGVTVHIAAPYDHSAENFKNLDITYHPIHLSRRGMNPFKELQTFIAFYRLYKSVRPDVVHHFTIKPVIYGTLAARFNKIKCIVNSITGMGYIFSHRKLKEIVLSQLIKLAYRFCLASPRVHVIFQNTDDQQYFIENKLIKPAQATKVKGSGIDLEQFAYQTLPQQQPPIILLASRMLWDKGIKEFVEAAKKVKEQSIEASFYLVGDVDPDNPRSVPIEYLKEAQSEGLIMWKGYSEKIKEVIASAYLVCLPSYYREGIPKVLLEAAAIGRPIITCDMPGCREAIIDKKTGLLIPPKNADALAQAIIFLLQHPEDCQKMSLAARGLAEAAFDERKVIETTLAIYKEGLLCVV